MPRNPINEHRFEGHLITDLELRSLPSGEPVLDFVLASTRGWKDKDSGADRQETTFYRCSAFGKTAENMSRKVVKGDGLLVRGSARTDQWKDAETGKNRSQTKFVVSGFTISDLPRLERPEELETPADDKPAELTPEERAHVERQFREAGKGKAKASPAPAAAPAKA